MLVVLLAYSRCGASSSVYVRGIEDTEGEMVGLLTTC